MRRLVGIVLITLGGAQLLVALGLIEAEFSELWPVGVIALGLWLLASAVRRPERGGLAVAILAIAVAGYQLGRSFLNWPDDLYLPVILIALGLGVLVRPGPQPKPV